MTTILKNALWREPDGSVFECDVDLRKRRKVVEAGLALFLQEGHEVKSFTEQDLRNVQKRIATNKLSPADKKLFDALISNTITRLP